MTGLTLVDDFLPNPAAYRKEALAMQFQTFHFPKENETFHGIARVELDSLVPHMLRNLSPENEPVLSFFRRSPLRQTEPHFIHTDVDMGDYTAVLYLNPRPEPGDGTAFWRHCVSGHIESPIAHQRSMEGMRADGWERRGIVESRFNRLLIFPASLFHSRALFDNCGAGASARLTQVTFLKRKP